jgi:hypothetical protein
MPYKTTDYDNCTFNPLAKGEILELYPKLRILVNPEWDRVPQLDELIRYVIICYDSKSPLWQERDYIRRREIAYDEAGLSKVNGEPDQDILTGNHQILFEMIIKYLAVFVKEKVFAALCAFEFKYYENIGELMTPVKGETNAERLEAAKKKSVISDEIITDIKRIDDLWMQVFGDKDMVEQVKTKKFKPELMGN